MELSELRLKAFLNQQPLYSESLSLNDYLTRLQQFWASPQTTGAPLLSRAAQLTKLFSAQMQIIAEHSDLPTKARALVERFYNAQRSLGQSPPPVFQLAIPTASKKGYNLLGGLLVITNEPLEVPVLGEEVVVLLELGQPWRAFDLWVDLRRYLLRSFAGPAGWLQLQKYLPLAHQEFLRNHAGAESVDLSKIHLTEHKVAKPPFAAVVELLLKQQKSNIAYQVKRNQQQAKPLGADLDKAASLQDRASISAVLAGYSNTAAKTYAQTALQTLRAAPDIYASGREYMKAQVKSLTGQEINPDHVYLHYFYGAVGSGTTYSGWEHPGQPTRSLTLTQLALANFTTNDEKSWPGDLDMNAGIYTEGPGSSKGYGVHNEFRLMPSTLMALDWEKDFYTQYIAKLDQFWRGHGSNYRALLKGRFVATCRAQWRQGKLAEVDYLALMSFALPKGSFMSTITLEQLREAPQRSGAASVRRFDLYGYASTDILHFVFGTKRQFLYLSDLDSARLISFDSTESIQAWVLEQARDNQKRRELAAHFSLYLRQDGITYSGVDTVLSALAAGRWKPGSTVDRNDSPITGDVFEHLLAQIQQRQRSDADTLISSNGELNEALWIGNISAFVQVVLPMVPACWPLGLVAGAASAALLGLGIDQTINGDTLAVRKQGAWTAFYATLDLLCSLSNGEADPEDPFAAFEHLVPPEPFSVADNILDGVTLDVDGVYRVDSQRWYVRQGEHIHRIAVHASGRQLVQVIRPEGGEGGSLFSLRRVGAEGEWQRISLKGGQPIVEDPAVRQHVRLGFVSRNSYGAVISSHVTDVGYDLVENAFRRVKLNRETNVWEAVDDRLYRPQADGMQEVKTGGEVFNAERMATLKALDIDIELPFDFTALNLPGDLDIPAQIYSIWIGDRAIKLELLQNMESNATRVKQGTRPYTLKLYLSSEHPEVFKLNKAALKKHAPTVEVVELETSDFYLGFKESRYFEQYRAAIDGNGGVARNFSSASDVLRYPLMKYHGGLYLDVDDTLTSEWASVEIKTTAEGLAVKEPVSHEVLNLDTGFNTSCFATQKDNPTLEAISAKSFERYEASREIYRDPRPVASDSTFNAYMRKISHIGGPGVFNDVIDEQLPELRRLRQLCLLRSRPMFARDLLSEIQTNFSRFLPLERMVDIGSENSWTVTRNSRDRL
ncbi:dermonecrotic toxin domain-containing protein [Pseudomonas vranovensis]